MNPTFEALWQRMPKIAQDAIATSVDRLRGVVVADPPQPDRSKPYRVLIGPVNYAGQGYRWGRALEATGQVSARNFVHEANNPFGYGADHVISWRTAEHSRKWQRNMLDAIRSEYTHVLIEACFPILGGMFRGDVRREVEVFREAGISVAVVGHGTDVRLPSRHMAETEWSHFHNSDSWVKAELVEEVVAANLALIDDIAAPTFVSTAGLMQDIPAAHFVGVVIDPDVWRTDDPPLQSKRLKVVHAPTNPYAKGTPMIMPTVERLVDEGLIEFTEIRGVPNSEMPRVFREADVVLDQFRAGDYGVGACETMAAGRIPLTFVTDQVRAEVQRHAGMPLPIPEVTVDTLEHVLRDIADNREEYRALALTGPEFVRRIHDGRFSADVLTRHFLEV